MRGEKRREEIEGPVRREKRREEHERREEKKRRERGTGEKREEEKRREADREHVLSMKTIVRFECCIVLYCVCLLNFCLSSNN